MTVWMWSPREALSWREEQSIAHWLGVPCHLHVARSVDTFCAFVAAGGVNGENVFVEFIEGLNIDFDSLPVLPKTKREGWLEADGVFELKSKDTGTGGFGVQAESFGGLEGVLSLEEPAVG